MNKKILLDNQYKIFCMSRPKVSEKFVGLLALTKYETTVLDTSTLPKFDISRSNFMLNAPMGARQRESVSL